MFTYTSRSGVPVTTCSDKFLTRTPDGGYGAPEDDFPTLRHYIIWSYLSWYSKVWIIPAPLRRIMRNQAKKMQR